MKKRFLLSALFLLFFVGVVWAEFSFYLIDNFEDGQWQVVPGWWKFGGVELECVKNQLPEKTDMVAQSCGEYSLRVFGRTDDWYVGGIGTNLDLDASPYSRLLLDLYGNKEAGGKVKIEIFDDDNGNTILEQDSNYEPLYDDKWVAEINILGPGFTRYSIPFTAFKDANPGIGDDTLNLDRNNGSGGLLKMQLVFIADQKVSKIDIKLDNILLTY